MKKSQIISYLDNKKYEILKPLRDKLKQMKNDERIEAFNKHYPDFISAVKKYIESKNAICDIVDQMDADDFALEINYFTSRINESAQEYVLAHSWTQRGWRYSVEVEALANEIAAISIEYITLKGNIKGMSAKKAIAYLQSLGFDIQPDAPSYLPIAPVDTQLLLGK